MSDIVERLRNAADKTASGQGEWYQLIHRCREAADRIERLEGEWAFALGIAERHQAEIEHLRTLGDALAEHLDAWIPDDQVFADDMVALYAWREARR